MKKLSSWGFYHPRIARCLMVLIKIVMILLAWYIGNILQLADIYFTTDSFYIIAICILPGVLLYPNEKRKKVYFERSYYIHQKLCDGIITFFSFSAFIILFNTNFSLDPAYGAKPIYRYGETTAQNYVNNSPGNGGKKMSEKKSKAAKRSFIKQIKQISSLAKKGNKEQISLILEMVFAITLGACLGIIVAALSCSLACSGNELAALLVLIFGAGAVATGLITWIRSIIKRKRKLAAMNKNPE